MTILLVDDDDDCLATLDVALQKVRGAVMYSTRTGEDAQKILARDKVAAVITDIHLPAMTGLELIAWIRKEPGICALPVMVVSADADPAAPHTALASGANAFFSKPFSPAAVRRKLEELIHAS